MKPNLRGLLSETLVPCYFIFGDSLVDNGNNNARNTLAKASYPPHGIDYPDGPTGRFTNGRNVADIVAELLGFNNHIPQFATASGNTILNGVNYGSGGAGILDNTGKQFFAALLIEQYSRKLRDLYTSGARKVAIFGLGPIGCVPTAIKGPLNGTSCISRTNDAVQIFNSKVKSLVDVLNKDLVGFKYTNIPCCTMSTRGGLSFLRTDFVYFDGFHPTEVAVAIVAKQAFSAQSPSDAYPFDIQHLAKVR
ncbi:Cutinase [Handroanthus impetiginosus]|uniref:Cutinase n=1 Tax=Handroanthus impetiginosus TaxID=429701 RepID=A0A2G9GGD4_9LAMI|nr:Cutinase [Handroanthus impetiginosus]